MISRQTWGWEWGPTASTELDDLARIGVNWAAIHPYGSIRADGTVGSRRLEGTSSSGSATDPEAHARGCRSS
jgi:hypothetical protein